MVSITQEQMVSITQEQMALITQEQLKSKNFQKFCLYSKYVHIIISCSTKVLIKGVILSV